MLLLLLSAANAEPVHVLEIAFLETMSDVELLLPVDGAERISHWIEGVDKVMLRDFPKHDGAVIEVRLYANAAPVVRMQGELTARGREWSWPKDAPLEDLRVTAAEVPFLLRYGCAEAPPAEFHPRAWEDRLPPGMSPGALDRAIVERARSYVLPVLALRANSVASKYKGVRSAGALATEMLVDKPPSASGFYQSAGYWRGVMEMVPGDLLVEALPLVAELAAGRTEAAARPVQVLIATGDADDETAGLLAGLASARQRLDEQEAGMIEEGIKLHDRGEYSAAVAVYDGVIRRRPCSIWAQYERAQSLFAAGELHPGADLEQVESTMASCDPLHRFPLQASGEAAVAQAQARLRLNAILTGQVPLLGSLATFADTALELGQSGFAAQLFWAAGRVEAETRPKEELFGDFLAAATDAGAPEVIDYFDGGSALVEAARARRTRR